MGPISDFGVVGYLATCITVSLAALQRHTGNRVHYVKEWRPGIVAVNPCGTACTDTTMTKLRCQVRYLVPGTGNDYQGNWYLVRINRQLLPGTSTGNRYQVPGTRYLVPGTGYQVPGTVTFNCGRSGKTRFHLGKDKAKSLEYWTFNGRVPMSVPVSQLYVELQGTVLLLVTN